MQYSLRCHLVQREVSYQYSREVKDGYSAPVRGVSYFLAMVPATVLLGMIGAMACSATGVANPINAFYEMVDSKIVLIVTLCFIIMAQLSTNLASNVIPPAYMLLVWQCFSYMLKSG